MKVIFFTDSISKFKTFGNAIRTCSFANNLYLRGHKVSIIFSKKSNKNDTLKGINIILFDFKKFVSKIILIKSELQNSDVAILSLFWEPSHILFIFLLIFFNIKKPFIIMTNGSLPIDKKSFFIKKLYMILFGNLIIKKSSLLIAVTNVESKMLKKYIIKKFFI